MHVIFPFILLTKYVLRQTVVESEMYNGEDTKPRNIEGAALTLSAMCSNSKGIWR